MPNFKRTTMTYDNFIIARIFALYLYVICADLKQLSLPTPHLSFHLFRNRSVTSLQFMAV